MIARRAARVSGLLTLALLAGVSQSLRAPAAAAQAAPRTFPVTFLRKRYHFNSQTLPSLLETHPGDLGLAGSQEAIYELNTAGRFIGWNFKLDVVTVPDGGNLAAAAQQLLAHGPRVIIADLRPDDLLTLAGLPSAKDALILDMRTTADRLRQQECRANVFHLLPSQAMRTDAIAQYLVWKRWPRWFIIQGPTPQDAVYAADIRRSAARYGAQVVAQRTYSYNPGSRRSDTGYQQIQTQMPLATEVSGDYDVIFVADESDLFGDYLPYNTYAARPVVGTQGLVASAWTPAYQEYAALQMQQRFDLFAHRGMTERDYGGWLAVRIVGNAVMRADKTAPMAMRKYLRSKDFLIAGYKGQGLTFRRWDNQLRQPVLLSTPLMTVSMSPQHGFLHPGYTTDTLGFDEPETKCSF
jgi:ABC transporter substrate binding protein (PQQ-dependent alcohol dehydrogenase system)